MAGRKIQLPAIGGIRKVIKTGGATGTTIAEFGDQSITLAQLKAALGITQTDNSSGNTGGGGATAFLYPDSGLSGGGALLGAVSIRLTRPPELILDGEDGQDGMQGLPGAQGLQGIQGIQGPPGDDGEDGQDGMQGLPGAAGAAGATGPAGADGPAGAPGAPGMDGMDGEDGQDGLPGPPGAPGATGATGPAGADGATGPAGVAGAPGLDGLDGEDGLDGLPGPAGPAGATGATGPTGIMGPAGFDGEDADSLLFLLPTPGTGGGTGANPSASVGLTAVNGSATTFLRSDGAPALSQSIAPTWTGAHTFTNAAGVIVSNTEPYFFVRETGLSANEKVWGWESHNKHMYLASYTDAYGSRNTILDVTRGTGTALVDLSFGNATDNPSFTFLGNGSSSFAGTMALSAPAGGTPLTITPAAGERGIEVNGATAVGSSVYLRNTDASDGRCVVSFSADRTSFYTYLAGIDTTGGNVKSFEIRDVTRGGKPLVIDSNGAISIEAPAAGVALTVNGIAGSATLHLAPADSASVGFRILDPGANATDFRINTTNTGINIQALGTVSTLNITAKSGVVIGSPTVSGKVSLDISAGLAAPSLRVAAGTATVQPIQLTSGTNLTSATQGAIEYDGTVRYFTPGSGSRAVDLVEYFMVLSADYTLTSQTAAQKAFNSTANGRVTLPIGTYEFECEMFITGFTGATANVGFALGGTATFTQKWWSLACANAGGTPATTQMTVNTTANVGLLTAGTINAAAVLITGIIRVTVAGTVIPQISMAVAAAAVMKDKSFFRCRPLGSATVTNVGNWS